MIGHAGAQRGRHEAAAAEALQLVAVGVRLADALEALGPHAHQLTAAEHPLGVLVAGQRRAALAGHRADQRHPEDQVRAERAQEAAGVVVDRDHRHQAVQGDRAGVVRDDQGAALGRDVVGAADLDAEPLLRDRAQRGHQEALGDLLVEAVLVDEVVAGDPAAQEGQELGELRLPLVPEELLGGVLERGEQVPGGDPRVAVHGRGGWSGRSPPCRGQGGRRPRRGRRHGSRPAGRPWSCAARRLARGARRLPRRGETAGRRRGLLAGAASGTPAGADRDDLGVSHGLLLPENGSAAGWSTAASAPAAAHGTDR